MQSNAACSSIAVLRTSRHLAGCLGWTPIVGPAASLAGWTDGGLLSLGIEPVIASKENGDRDARPVQFDRQKYRRRNIGNA